ncbi:MAG: metal ABC transporter permease [Candidatus Peregrinibacteria bacterium]
MLEIFEYDFMVRAFIVGILCAIVTAVVGNFLVASRQAVISDMLAHTSLAGVGLGIFLHFSPNILGAAIAVFASVLLFFLNRQKKIPPEAISMLLLTGGLAVALLFAHFSKDNPLSLESFLFGSLLTTTTNEVLFFGILGSFILVFLFLFWNRFLCRLLDTDFFASRFPRGEYWEVFFLVIVGILVAFSLKIIGGLLISALLVIPVITAQTVANSFRTSVAWSVGINILGVIMGLFFSFYQDIPSSSAIVLSLIGLFLVFFLSGSYAYWMRTIR